MNKRLKGWTGVVLAGGKSSRMGSDKSLMPLYPGGPTLLDHALDRLAPLVDELLVVGNPEKHGHVGPFVIADDLPGKGPLGGLVTAMRYAGQDRLLVLAVDMPNVDQELLMRLTNGLGHFTDAVIPRHGGRSEPLCAAYHRRCATTFQMLLEQDRLKMSEAIEHVRTAWIEVSDAENGPGRDLFRNVNKPEDL